MKAYGQPHTPNALGRISFVSACLIKRPPNDQAELCMLELAHYDQCHPEALEGSFSGSFSTEGSVSRSLVSRARHRMTRLRAAILLT